MFVPVACSQCGKPFQAPEAELGKPVVCPWCRATVPALPVAAPAAAPGDSRPPARPDAPQPAESPPASRLPWPQPEPLSLDDAPPAEAKPKAPPPPARRAARPAVPRSKWFWWWAAVLGVVTLVVVTAATVAVLRYKQGHVLGSEWRAFSPPDGSFTVELLGKPTEDATAETGVRRYAAEGWYSGTVTWVGWRDLTPVERQYALAKDGWVQLREKLFDPERDRLAAKYGGTVAKQATPKLDNPIVHEVRVQYDGGQAVERTVVAVNDFSARVYFVGIAGRIDPDGEDVKRFLDSFKVTE
jgi:hypothetical protein